MKIHEFQAKEVLRRYGVTTPEGEVTEEASEAEAICRRLGGRAVVKAQIHAGGRGKGGGVKLAGSPEEAAELAEQILGMRLVTPQTGSEGQTVRKVLVEEALDIDSELYLSVTLDRALGKPMVMGSAAGGMDIEEVAAERPEAIVRQPFDPHLGLLAFEARAVASGLGLDGELAKKAVRLVSAVARAYLDTDATLVEINPLVVTSEGEILALDAKMSFDDNALYRHEEIREMRDLDEEDPLEVEASHFDLNYIKLDGEIGCMVNGAGLAMATMDIIKLYGSEPANFLDVGGSASQEAVENAFRILVSDDSVRAVLINIFGGIARTDRIAAGVVGALEELGDVGLPVVVRLEGTNVEEGRRILQEADFDFIVAEHMADAADKVVAASRGGADRSGAGEEG
ncbi:MAG: ADP-forming succinate--CoA ligase subunit beta [Thermoanaerobaculia bacterium]|nr:ADP-forming succinate--CoA ligase subunit beta [Thermoanaerobaculia bacterium]